MARYMLIDATHKEETRVALVKNNRLEDFDFETKIKPQIKSNIYLAKVIRVEPSLQAAFVDFGGNRHGFLAFSEIHPDYYRVPVSDRQETEEEPPVEEEEDMALADLPEGSDEENSPQIEILGGMEGEDVSGRKFKRNSKYKIQEVIKKRQIMLVQVIKEERGNKGAALTTYLSLAGRYCVLMPNAGREGGISRKITDTEDRKRLRSIIDSLEIPEGMGLILRTAGMERTKAEIKRDYDYLIGLWNDIRTLTLQSTAPTLIHEEGALIKRALRDLYSREIDKIIVDGEEGYQSARNFIRKLTPSHTKKVEAYKHQKLSLFQSYKIDEQIESIFNPVVPLPSGGYLVVSQTEALVAIDVNSGKATRERHIEETAFKTNMEAAYEVARQLRLRNLAGLVVIDFIDMEDTRNITAVERRLKEAMSEDKARIQIGRISPFGLLELSRQRLRPSVLESHTESCPYCKGTGVIRMTESAVLHILRQVEMTAGQSPEKNLLVFCHTDNVIYILNHKRAQVREIETTYRVSLVFQPDNSLLAADFKIEKNLDPRPIFEETPSPTKQKNSLPAPSQDLTAEEEDQEEELSLEEELSPSSESPTPERTRKESFSSSGKRRRHKKRRFSSDSSLDGDSSSQGASESFPLSQEEPGEEKEGNVSEEDPETSSLPPFNSSNRRRRRRRRRGGERWGQRPSFEEGGAPSQIPHETVSQEASWASEGSFSEGKKHATNHRDSLTPLSSGETGGHSLFEGDAGHPRKGWWQRLIKK